MTSTRATTATKPRPRGAVHPTTAETTPSHTNQSLSVSLITEGTYPYVDGGVSVWCDQLVRGLAQHEFNVDAITTTGTESSSWDLPANIGTIRSVPLWEPVTPRWASRPLLPGLRDALVPLLMDITSPQRSNQFEQSLEELFYFGQYGLLQQSLLSDEAVGLTLEALRTRDPFGRRIESRPVAPTVADAVASLRLLEHLLRPLSAAPPEVDLCHVTSNGVGVLLAMGAKWLYGTPFLLTEHGLYLRERYIAYSPDTLPHHQRAFVLGFFKQLTATSYKVADLIVPVCEYNRYWELANGADPQKVQPVYNGVHAPTFTPPSVEPDVPTLTWVGRIDPLKDVKTMLRAFAIVKQKMPEARLRMFGGTPKGNERYFAECVELSRRLGLGSSATFEGKVPSPTTVSSIAEAYHAGHVVVSTSISEGFPYSVIEAMASGRAVVATDVGGVGEAVKGVGILVPPRNAAAIAEACLSLLRAPGKRSRLARRGRNRVLESFTLDVCLNHFRDVYASLTEPKNGVDQLSLARERRRAADLNGQKLARR